MKVSPRELELGGWSEDALFGCYVTNIRDFIRDKLCIDKVWCISQ